MFNISLISSVSVFSLNLLDGTLKYGWFDIHRISGGLADGDIYGHNEVLMEDQDKFNRIITDILSRFEQLGYTDYLLRVTTGTSAFNVDKPGEIPDSQRIHGDMEFISYMIRIPRYIDWNALR